MATITMEPSATCTIGGVTVQAGAGVVTLDSSWSPYGQARVTLPLVDATDAEDIDPRVATRAVLTGINDSSIGDTSRVFDLGVRSRRVDHAALTVEVELATDEAVLQDWAPLSTDETPLSLQASLRSVIDYALDQAGLGGLESGPDVDATRYWSITNLLINPSAETGVHGWSQGTGAAGIMDDIAMGSPPAVQGSRAIGFAAAAGDSNILPAETPTTTTTYPVRPGEWYTFSFYIVSSVGRNARAAIQWWSADGKILSETSFGATAMTNNTAFQRRSVIAQAPEGATHGMPYVNTMGNTGGGLHYVDCAMFYVGRWLVPYFDGDTPDTAHYINAWQRDAHNSTSTRTAVDEALPEALIWETGVSAWDFLQPLVNAYQRRLFCDEKRDWRLIESDYLVPGVVNVAQGFNAVAGEDLITRDDEQLWADGVVVRYKWRTAGGLDKTQDDTAGTSGKVRLVEYDRPYPGPGAAAYILNGMQGRGRTQDVVALANYDATPGMEVAIALPGTFDQLGVVRAVSWDINNGLMKVASRGLTAAPPEAWVMLDVGESWDDAPVGGTWVGEAV